jgi:hypothetical protein
MKKTLIATAILAATLILTSPAHAAISGQAILRMDEETNLRIDALEARITELERVCLAPQSTGQLESRISALEAKVDVIQKNVMAVLTAVMSFLSKLIK